MSPSNPGSIPPRPGIWTRLQAGLIERFHIRLESLIVLVVLTTVMAILSPYFLSVSNFMNILLATSTIGVLAIAATFVLSSGGLDLSLGSVLGLSGVVGAAVAVKLGAPTPAAVLTTVAAGALAGFVNGMIVTRAFVPAFIVTLGMLGIARGLALILSDGRVIYGLPKAMVYLGQGRPFGIPMPVILFIATAIVMHIILAYTRYGRHTLAIGDNENAARTAGINIERHRLSLYTLSGALAGFAGLLFATRINSGDPTAGITYELTAITAAIIGGTNLFGGRGSIMGTMIGALIMGVLQNGLNLAVFIDQWQVRKESRV